MLVVNKADREGADRAAERSDHDAGSGAARAPARAAGTVPVLTTVGVRRRAGIGRRWSTGRHRALCAARPRGAGARVERRRRQAEAQVLAIAGELGRRRAARPARRGALALVDDVAARRRDPYGAAAELVAALLDGDRIDACVARLRSRWLCIPCCFAEPRRVRRALQCSTTITFDLPPQSFSFDTASSMWKAPTLVVPQRRLRHRCRPSPTAVSRPRRLPRLTARRRRWNARTASACWSSRST